MVKYFAKVTAKGQVKLPVEVRRALAVKPGHHVQIESTKGGAFIMRPDAHAADLRGLFPAKARPSPWKKSGPRAALPLKSDRDLSLIWSNQIPVDTYGKLSCLANL